MNVLVHCFYLTFYAYGLIISSRCNFRAGVSLNIPSFIHYLSQEMSETDIAIDKIMISVLLNK